MVKCFSVIFITQYCTVMVRTPPFNRIATLQLAVFHLMLAERKFSNQLQTHVTTKRTAVCAKDSICVTFASITSMTTRLISAPKMLIVIFRDLCTPGLWHLKNLKVIEVASIKNEGPSLMVRLDHVCYTLLALLLRLLNEYELPWREVKISPDIHWFPGFNQHMKFAGQRGIKPTNAGTSGSSCPVSRKRWKARVCT